MMRPRGHGRQEKTDAGNDAEQFRFHQTASSVVPSAKT
jgi:hypothetical protein